MIKKLLCLLLVLCISHTALPAAAAITPLNVAVLPVINTAHYRYAEDIEVIQNTIKKPFKYPYYTLIPSAVVEKAYKEFLVQNKGVRLSDEKAMAELANTLSADIVVAVELSKFRMDRITSFWLDDDTYVESDIVLKCYAYSALSKKYDVIKAVKSEREYESINTNADVVFKDLTEEILVKLPYKRIPTNVTNNF